MTNTTNPDVDKLITFGQMALEQGWYDHARQCFEEALELDAANQEAADGLARANEILSRRTDMPVEPIQVEPVESPSEPESTREPEPSPESVTPPQERMEPPHIEWRLEEVKSKEFIELTCRNCGGHLIVVEESDQFTCPYCGTVYEAKRDKGVIAFRQLKEGVEGIRHSTDLMASELGVIIESCGLPKQARRCILGVTKLHNGKKP